MSLRDRVNYWAARYASGPVPLDPLELRGLHAWVQRRMKREAEHLRRRGQDVSHEALVSAVAEDLGLATASATALCELAGWPS